VALVTWQLRRVNGLVRWRCRQTARTALEYAGLQTKVSAGGNREYQDCGNIEAYLWCSSVVDLNEVAWWFGGRYCEPLLRRSSTHQKSTTVDSSQLIPTIVAFLAVSNPFVWFIDFGTTEIYIEMLNIMKTPRPTNITELLGPIRGEEYREPQVSEIDK
jgi:hypothetical protein